MEGAAERQRAGRVEVVEDKGSVERPWGEAEVLALMTVWDEVGAQHVAGSRSTFQLISERLRRLSIVRSWWECQAQCRSLGLHSRKCDAAAANYSPEEEEEEDEEEEDRLEEGWEEEEDEEAHRGIYSPSVSVPMQEGLRSQIHRTLPYTAPVAEEGGRHWTDDEVRALLCVWADCQVRERLKSTLRNKCIFQEMSLQMQRTFGVVRNWKQCRTKYKNLKYDHKTAKSAHAATGSGSGGPGKYMKFFDEVDAILMDRGLEEGTVEMQRRLYNGEVRAERLHTPGSESELVIEIDDDSNDYDANGDMEARWKRGDAHLALTDQPDQFHVVTVPDTGRNWSEQEVRALIQVWSDERVCRQLESSTRKRDIFVQISNRLMQQGIDRDWKQCHTKYKNLKYLYRSLQRGMTDETDPRRIMRFYDEVDAVMNRTRNGSLRDKANRDPVRLSASEDSEDKEHIRESLNKVNSETTSVTEDRTCSSGSLTSVSLEVPAQNKEPRIHAVREGRSDLHHRFMSSSHNSSETPFVPSRRNKRRFIDQGETFQTAVKRLYTQAESADNPEVQCKEEGDCIPIIKINSVRSMVSTDTSPDRQVIKPKRVQNVSRLRQFTTGKHTKRQSELI